MGLLDLFKRKDSVPEKVESCEKTDSAANAVKEIRDKILQKTAIPCMKLELTDTKPGLFDSKVGGVGYVPRDAKIPEDSEGTQLRGCWRRSTVQRSRWKIFHVRGCCNSGF